MVNETAATTIILGAWMDGLSQENCGISLDEAGKRFSAWIEDFNEFDLEDWADILLAGGHIGMYARKGYDGNYDIDLITLYTHDGTRWSLG